MGLQGWRMATYISTERTFVLFQELHCLMLLGVPPHVALQAIHICGGEVTHATSVWLIRVMNAPVIPDTNVGCACVVTDITPEQLLN